MDALVSISIVLLVMLFTIYRRFPLDATIFIGVVLTSLLFGRILFFVSDAFDALADLKTLSLMLMVYFVFFLNNFLTGTGVMRSVVNSLERVIASPRVIIAVIPALIGLIPAPSGSVLSAPFADEIGGRSKVVKERRMLINYWFRHLSEYINPVYPGILLATAIIGVPFRTFFVSNLPVMVVYTLLGVFFYLLAIKGRGHSSRSIGFDDLAVMFKGITPIVIAVALPLAFNLDLSISLLVSIIVALLLNFRGKVDFAKIAKESLKLDLIMLVFLVMFFKQVLLVSGASNLISVSLVSLGIPVVLLLVVLPMIMGFLTGLTIGFVGLTFPILLPFLLVDGVLDVGLATLAFVSGYLGILLSPMHLCFSVTREYFKADLNEVYRMLFPPVVLTFLFTLAYVYLTN